MKEEKEDSIDKLFSRGLSNPGDNASYREEDWERLEFMLDGKKPKSNRRNIIYLITTAAAMLLMLIGWLFFRPNIKTDNAQQITKGIPRPKQDSGNYGSPKQQRKDLASNTLSAGISENRNNVVSGRKSKSFFTLSAAAGGRTTTGSDSFNYNLTGIPGASNGTGSAVPVKDTTLYGSEQPQIASVINQTRVDTIIPDDNKTQLATIARQTKQDTTPPDADKPQLASVTNDIKKPAKTSQGFLNNKPTLAITVLASPDVNSVGGFNNTRVGTNAGLLFTVGLSKWSISTGVIYADKPYASPFSKYSTAYKFTTNPTQVFANCSVLDIPLNIGYQVYSKNRNKFSVGTGLSSYFMLRENYSFDYPAYGTPGPATYNIRNQNKHIMGVLNLNATYQREVSARFGIGVQPYLKLPLTGIGYGQVNLKSAGVAVGVTWNIISAKQP
ncbi:hypothetical protein ACFQZX_06750 [Mucilaginibacter litoreus]|uniref:Outer membrane protein beta-barrel domain-containing protein n=1 Tax=Mucilaginibacter litoreus TaxID=1048221 RepID=A0ABW3AS31_9SPHI